MVPPEPPGGGPGGGDDLAKKALSYAERARTNIKFDHRLKRNVLEIEVEKSDKDDEINLGQDCVARLLRTIGMDIDLRVEGYQVSYGKISRIAVWCKEGIDLEKFCRDESSEVSRGASTKSIRPSGRKDVSVTVSGLNFNIPDTFVQEYLTKFGGKMVSNSVIYDRHGDGPFKGKVNGDRKYQVDFSGSSLSMGTYHYLDGERIRVYFRGNIKTCGRCHQSAQTCLGGGIARNCQSEGGQRVDLFEHMRNLWATIGFNPTAFQLPEREVDDSDGSQSSNNLKGDQKIIDAAYLKKKIENPQLTNEEKDKITGIKITNFPLDIKEEEILKFLQKTVDGSISGEILSVTRNERNSQVSLESTSNRDLMFKAAEIWEYKKTREMTFPGRPLYIRLLRTLTPEKGPNKAVPEADPKGVKLIAQNLDENKLKDTPKKPTAAANASASAGQVPKYKHTVLKSKK